MRQLTRKQKRLLDEWFEKNKDKLSLSFQPSDEIFPGDLYHELEEINDTEILFQEVARYITDKVADLMHRPSTV